MCHCREELMREVLTLSNLSCSDDNTMEATFTSQAMPCHAMQRQRLMHKQASKHQCQHGHFGPLVMKPFRAEKCNGSSSSSGGITDDFSACQHVRVTQS